MKPKDRRSLGANDSATPRKRKRGSENAETVLDTSKPTAVFQPSGGRKHTLSIALPGSIIANAQSHDAKTVLAGHIARALAVFCVDEVIIFDDGQAGKHSSGYGSTSQAPESGYTGYADPVYFLTHLLAYLETPPHLRKHLFPLHPDLRTAGTLPSLDMPHHLRTHEWCRFREGVAIEGESKGTEEGPDRKKRKKQKRSKKNGVANSTDKVETLVDAGFANPITLPEVSIPPYTRVTLQFESSTAPDDFQNMSITAQAVAPSAPREEDGYYWGYSVRSCVSLSAVLTETPFEGGYDLTIGTSERGIPVSSMLHREAGSHVPPIPMYSHMLIVFGGVAGLEPAVKADPELVAMGLVGPEKLFDYWVNLCPGQGSRTIRTEEAVWLGLMGLREVVLSKGRS